MIEAELQKEMEKIPQENLLKFLLDWQKLAQYAQREDYDNYDLQWR